MVEGWVQEPLQPSGLTGCACSVCCCVCPQVFTTPRDITGLQVRCCSVMRHTLMHTKVGRGDVSHINDIICTSGTRTCIAQPCVVLAAGHPLSLHARHETGQPRAAGKHWGQTHSKAADLAVEAGTLGGRGWAVPSTAQATAGWLAGNPELMRLLSGFGSKRAARLCSSPLLPTFASAAPPSLPCLRALLSPAVVQRSGRPHAPVHGRACVPSGRPDGHHAGDGEGE